MSWRRLAAWCIVLAALIGAWQYLERRGRSAKEDDAREARLIGIERDTVTGITIRRGEATVAFEKGSDGWLLTSPIRWKADDAKLDSLLAEVAGGRVERVVAAAGSADLAQYGLAQDAILVEVTGPEGARAKLSIGGRSAMEGKTYVSRGASGEVALVPASLGSIVASPVDDFRDRTILPIAVADGIELDHGTTKVVSLSRTGKRWAISHPFSDRADGRRVESLVSRLRDLRIASFVADAPGDLGVWGLDRPALTVRVTAGGKPDATLLIGAESGDGRLFAMRGDGSAVFTVPGEVAEASLLDPAGWRDPSPLAFTDDDLRGIEVSWSGSSLSLLRSDDDWRIEGRPEYPVDRWEVRTLTTTLAGLSAESPPVTAGRGRVGSEIGRVTLKGEGEKVIDRLTVSVGPSAGVRMVSSDSRPGLAFALASAAVDKIAAYAVPFSVRKKEVFALDMGRVSSVTVTADGKGYRLERDGKRWTLVEPSKRTLEENEANDLLWDLGAVKATGLVAEGDFEPSAYGLDRPILSVSATLSDGSAAGALAVGSRAGDAHHASAGDPAAVYLVPAATVERIAKAFSALNR